MKKAIFPLSAMLLFFASVSSAQYQNGLTENFYTAAPEAPVQIASPPADDAVQTTPAPDPVIPAPIVAPPAPAPIAVTPPVNNDIDFSRGVTTSPVSGVTLWGPQGAVGKAVTMNACGALGIGSGNECKAVRFSEKFVPYLVKNIPKCVNQALAAMHKPKATGIFINYADALNQRYTDGKKSMHGTGRAIDISSLVIKTASGESMTWKMTRASKNEIFYKTMNKCWEDQTKARSDCRGMNVYGWGMIDCRDSDHQDHVHYSMPFCPPKNDEFKTT